MLLWNSFAFSKIQQMLTIWSLVPLPFLKSSLGIWKFMVHILLKPCLENFEHYFASVWDECSCVVVWTFFGIALLKWKILKWKNFKDMGIPDHLTCLLRNLHAGQEATVRTGHRTTDWLLTGKGVRQGCILSPCLLICRIHHSKCQAGWSTS